MKVDIFNTGKKYDIIYADPPWMYRDTLGGKAMSEKRTKEDLRELQALPLDLKILKTKNRIKEFYDFFGGQVYVSFSGGKDSTVLLHIARELYPDIEAVFVDTGLEYPEVRQHVKSFDNVIFLRPKMRFDEVIKTYGYPVISKDVSQTVYYARTKNSQWALRKLNGLNARTGEPSPYMERYKKYKALTEVDFNCSNFCCLIMKEAPLREISESKKPIVGIMASESVRRLDAWIKTGCNAFDSKQPLSKPMSFWTNQDVLQFLKSRNIPIASVYGDIVYKGDDGMLYENSICGGNLCTTGCDRTGCMFCAFGAHLEDESRFVRLKQTHPKHYKYCMDGGEYVNGIWRPNSKGLGMAHVLDTLNRLYGKDFIKY